MLAIRHFEGCAAAWCERRPTGQLTALVGAERVAITHRTKAREAGGRGRANRFGGAGRAGEEGRGGGGDGGGHLDDWVGQSSRYCERSRLCVVSGANGEATIRDNGRKPLRIECFCTFSMPPRSSLSAQQLSLMNRTQKFQTHTSIHSLTPQPHRRGKQALPHRQRARAPWRRCVWGTGRHGGDDENGAVSRDNNGQRFGGALLALVLLRATSCTEYFN